MGSPESEEERFPDEGPQHRVTFTRGYWLADTPCTQALWVAVMGSNPSHFKQSLSLPVENVSWDDINSFLATLNAHCPMLNAALPTEAQWEYACRATSTGARYGDLDEIAWHETNSGEQTHEVGQKLANAWGLHDMLGNVWEWCAEPLGSYTATALVDPPAREAGEVGEIGEAEEAGPFRVVRGGSAGDGARIVRAAYRDGYRPGYRYDDLGFRLVRGQ